MHVLPCILVLDGGHVHGPDQVEVVGVVRRVAAENHFHPFGQQLGHAPVVPDAPTPLGGRDGAHGHRRPRPGQALDLGFIHAERVSQHDIGSKHGE